MDQDENSESNWQTLLRVARPLVASPDHGAQQVKAMQSWFVTTPADKERADQLKGAIDAIVELQAPDLPRLYATVKTHIEDEQDRPHRILGYRAVVATMADYLGGLERRGRLIGDLRTLSKDLGSSYTEVMGR